MRTYFCPKCGLDLPTHMGLYQLMYEDRIAACEVCNPPDPPDPLDDDRDQTQPVEYTEKHDWSKHDFDSDPDWR